MKEKCTAYLRGTATPAEEREVLDFLKASARNRTEFAAWREEWMTSEVPSVAQMRQYAALDRSVRGWRRRRILQRTGIAACAVAAVLALGVLLLPGLSFRPSPKPIAVETGYLEKTRIDLPDGSTVHLNASSRLSYNADFGRKNRDVTLRGEAYFDVAPDEDLPFVVTVGEESVTVHGTKFNLTAFEGEKNLTAVLIEGSIAFHGPGTDVLMEPGERLVYDRTNGDLIKSQTDATQATRWLSGQLAFESITLPDLLQRLSSIYGVQFAYTPGKYADRPISIILSDKEPLRNILSAVSVLLPISWRNEDGRVLITEQ